MTYKSTLWQILFYGGLIVTALAQLANPAEYGIPLAAVPYIKLLALIAAVVGGKLGASPLPAEPGQTPGAGAKTLGVMLLAALSLTLGGCHAFVRTPTPDTQVVKVQEVVRTAELLRQAGVVAAGVQQIEIAAYDSGHIPPITHRQIQQAFLDVSVAVQEALRAMADLTVPTAARRTSVERALTAIDVILERGVPAVLDSGRREQLRAGLLGVRGIVAVALSLMP